jgi:hypothetical protein
LSSSSRRNRLLVVESGVAEAASQLERVDRICLDTSPFDVSASGAHEFVTRNMGCLVLSIGQLTDEGLRESALSAVSDSADKMDLWRRLRQNAQARMHKEASVVNPRTGARAEVPSHRHTHGAHQLAKRGCVMLAVAGTNRFEFDDMAPAAGSTLTWASVPLA